jgi:hypothetical protein
MHTLCNRIMFLIITAHIFCCGMDEKNKLVSIVTSDKQVSILEKWKVRQSLVLSVLCAHQKESFNLTDTIIIPKACNSIDDIQADDVRLLGWLLDNQGDKFKPYMDMLHYKTQKHLFCACDVLGASWQLFRVVDYMFEQPLVDTIGSKMIGYDVQEYLLKCILRKNEIFEDPKHINSSNWNFCSQKNGSFFYVPQEITPYQNYISFDGVSPFKAPLPIVGKDDLPIKAVGCNGNYYITSAGVPGNKEVILWRLKGSEYNQQKLSENEGHITHIVCDSNGTSLVTGSQSKENNLCYWTIDSSDSCVIPHMLFGHDGPIGEVIISNDGTYIASAGKSETDVIVWNVKNNSSQRLRDNYRYPVTAMAFSKDSTQLWTCSGSIISLWQLCDKGCFCLLNSMQLCNQDAVICRVLVNEKIGRIIVGRTDGKLNIICTRTNKELYCLQGHKKCSINGLISNNDGGIIISSINDISDNLIMWDVFTGEIILRLKGHPGIRAILLTPDMRYIVSQSPRDNALWEMYTEPEAKIIQDIYKECKFLHCYALYLLCKMAKNHYKFEKDGVERLLSLPTVFDVKQFLEKYLLEKLIF